MKLKRFREEQIIAILKQSEGGLPFAELLRQHGTADATFYHWKIQYGGMELSDAKWLKQLEDENRRMKRLVAYQTLNIQILQDVNSGKH